jgi:hypothetical protein
MDDPPKKPSFKKALVARSKADPFRRADYKALCVFAPLLAGVMDDKRKAAVGWTMAETLEKSTAAQLEVLFAVIVKMKKNIEDEHIQRSTYAVAAFFRFKSEHGHSPSKLELKRFIIENPKVYPGFPLDESNSEWTRIWKNADMNHSQWFPKS